MFALFSVDCPMLPLSQRLLALASAIALTGVTIVSVAVAALTLFPA